MRDQRAMWRQSSARPRCTFACASVIAPSQACSPLGVLEFRGLEEASGAYRIEIADARFAAESVAFELGTSAYLGTIRLRPR